jgi:hypothetical protein
MRTWIAMLTIALACCTAAAQFEEITSPTRFPGATGLGWGDYDNDGYADLLVAGTDQGAPLGGIHGPLLYHNNGDGTFTEVGADLGLPQEALRQEAAKWADTNMDGYLDVVLPSADRGPYYYLLLDDGTRFAEANEYTGVPLAGPARDVAWGDYMYPGDVDLFVPTQGEDSCLFLGNFGYFDEQHDQAGVHTHEDPDIDAMSAAWGDYDGDGWADLLIARARGPAMLYHNNSGDGTFLDASASSGLSLAFDTSSATWGDYDNDGWLDCYLTSSLTTPGRDYLFHNNQDGTFAEVGATAGMAGDLAIGYAATWVDYDNDGWLDLYVGNWNTSGATPSFLYHNNGDGTFTNVLAGSGLEGSLQNMGAGWADYDHDGRLDLAQATADGYTRLFHNTGPTGNWLRVRATIQPTPCVLADPDGFHISLHDVVGTRVEVNLDNDPTFPPGRTLTRLVDGSNSLGGQNEVVTHFGLGTSSLVAVRLTYPTAHTVIRTDIAANQQIALDEILQRVGCVTGHVYDDVTGDPIAPVAEAGVYVVDGYGAGPTDDTGFYAFGGVEEGVITLRATAKGYRPVTVTGVSMVAETEVSMDFRLVRTAGSIGGVVRDALTEQPIAGASVWCTGDREATTGADGAYLFADLPLGDNYVITAWAPGYDGTNLYPIVVVDQQTTEVNVDLVPLPGRIVGRVTDARAGAAPVVGATVACGDHTTTTDANGDYVLEDLPAGPGQALTVTALGFVDATVAELTVPSQQDLTVDVALVPVFADILPDDWALAAIMACADAGIVAGYGDGNYHSDWVVTRGQMAVFLARALVAPFGEAGVPSPTVTEPTFSDVTPDGDCAWCYRHVEYLAARGIVNGYWDGTYHPDETVTRAQMAVFVARAFELL